MMRENQDIVQVDESTLVNEVPKDIIHQGLEDCCGIGEAKGHYKLFKVPEECIKDDLLLISLPNPDQVLSVPQVHKNVRPMEWFKGGTDERQGILVLDGYVIETTVINTRMEQVIFLAHKEETSSYWQRRHADDTNSQRLIDIVLHCLYLRLGQVIEL